MRLSSDKVLSYVSQKASDGDEKAKIAYEYLKSLVDQWEKLEKINHKLDYIERCKKISEKLNCIAITEDFVNMTKELCAITKKLLLTRKMSERN